MAYIKSSGRCAMNISTLESLMRITLAKIPVEFLDFEDIWNRWMSVKDKRFGERVQSSIWIVFFCTNLVI
jgi:hypothetical protein